jgi:hypothetical protein
MTNVADALRKVTAAMQWTIASGERSTRLDAEDLIQVLLAGRGRTRSADAQFQWQPGRLAVPNLRRRRRRHDRLAQR